MKTILKVFGLSLLVLASCGRQKKAVNTLTLKEEGKALWDSVRVLESDTTLTEDETTIRMVKLMKEVYNSHNTDSLGCEVFRVLCMYVSWDEAKALYAEADTLIKNNKRVCSMMKRLESQQEMQVGASYKDIEGPDVSTGEKLSISAFLGKGKPVLLDFFASWCSPCKQCIKEHLSVYVQQHPDEISVLGIDVWEKKRSDIDSVMRTLPITWPVIYTTEEDGADLKYGVDGVPTLILLDADGKIVARGHSLEDVGLIE